MTHLSIPTARVISEVLDGEAIIIDSMSGAYYTLDADGTAVWGRLAAGATTAAELSDASGLGLARVNEVVSELVTAGLIVADGEIAPADGSSASALTKYTDMEELLLLDPIHDVDPAGWPVLPSDA